MLKQLLSLLNGMILEKELVMSASLFSLLSKMNHDIAKIIIDIHTKKVDIGDNSYVDIHPDKLGDITMLSARRAENLPEDQLYTATSRATTGIGRLVRSLLLKYGYTNDNGTLKKEGSDDIKGRDIELFVNEFKALKATSEEGDKNFRLVKGDDIAYWYYEGNYMDDIHGSTLAHSCMRYRGCQSYFDIYTKEPAVSMLIYTDLNEEGEEKLLGRALVWDAEVRDYENLNLPKMVKFMDRIYFGKPHIEDLFNNYAGENNIETEASLRDQAGSYVTLVVQLTNDYTESSFPYVDTLSEFDVDENTLSNSGYDTVTLNDTSGGPSINDCQECRGSGEYECWKCEGDGESDCRECGGYGKHGCWRCDGNEVYDCQDCNEGFVECRKCRGDGCEDCNQGTTVCGECNGNWEDIDCDCDEGYIECDSCDGRDCCDVCNGEGNYDCDECGGTGTR
jgi:hypothetical protein